MSWQEAELKKIRWRETGEEDNLTGQIRLKRNCDLWQKFINANKNLDQRIQLKFTDYGDIGQTLCGRGTGLELAGIGKAIFIRRGGTIPVLEIYYESKCNNYVIKSYGKQNGRQRRFNPTSDVDNVIKCACTNEELDSLF
jgi:hypothetical protein